MPSKIDLLELQIAQTEEELESCNETIRGLEHTRESLLVSADRGAAIELDKLDKQLVPLHKTRSRLADKLEALAARRAKLKTEKIHLEQDFEDYSSRATAASQEVDQLESRILSTLDDLQRLATAWREKAREAATLSALARALSFDYGFEYAQPWTPRAIPGSAITLQRLLPQLASRPNPTGVAADRLAQSRLAESKREKSLRQSERQSQSSGRDRMAKQAEPIAV